MLLVTGLPLNLRFRTKGQLAIDVLADAHGEGLSFDFACGDEVYGSCTELREFLEDRGLVPLSVREVKRLLAAALCRPGTVRPHRPLAPLAMPARSRWFHKRARLARNYALVS